MRGGRVPFFGLPDPCPVPGKGSGPPGPASREAEGEEVPRQKELVPLRRGVREPAGRGLLDPG